jgi:hypothetical protein
VRTTRCEQPRAQGANRKPASRRLGAGAAFATWLIVISLFAGVNVLPAQTPADFKIEVYSGSYAPWGINQLLTIQPSGEVSFYQSDVDEDYVDSLFTVLDSLTMVAIYDTVLAVGFFGLDSLYESGAVDGSGIALRITAMGTAHEVEAVNIAVDEVNRLALYLNSVLASAGMEIKYGTIND